MVREDTFDDAHEHLWGSPTRSCRARFWELSQRDAWTRSSSSRARTPRPRSSAACSCAWASTRSPARRSSPSARSAGCSATVRATSCCVCMQAWDVDAPAAAADLRTATARPGTSSRRSGEARDERDRCRRSTRTRSSTSRRCSTASRSYRPRRRGWTWREPVADQHLYEFCYRETSKALEQQRPAAGGALLRRHRPAARLRRHDRDRLGPLRRRHPPHAHGRLARRRPHDGHPHRRAEPHRRAARGHAGGRGRHRGHAQAGAA